MSSGLTWEGIRYGLQRIAAERGELAGYPMLIDGRALRTAPGHMLDGARLDRERGEEEEKEETGYRQRNSWWCAPRRTTVHVIEEPDGRISAGYRPFQVELAALFNFDRMMKTIESGLYAWDFAAELTAMETLAGLVTKPQFESYILHGLFFEKSKRSQAAYIFRRLRPTIVLLPQQDAEKMRPTTALCLHPLAYYDGTFAGGMVPTDDVIAHLMLMRGDEHLFWRRANQHPIDRPEAGL